MPTDNAYLAAEWARGLSEILMALAESPTVPTRDAFVAASVIADKIAETAVTPSIVPFNKVA